MSKKRRSIKKEEVNEPIITAGMKLHLKYLIGLSILSKVLVVIFTVFILGSFMDMYGMVYYYDNILSIVNGSGNYPYLNFYYVYPILSFVPSFISVIPSLLFNSSVSIFIIVFSTLMVICDCITVACVYLIARKIWNDPKKAFISAFIYLTAISTAYFVMIEHSPFAECFLMIALTIVFYGKEIFGFSRVNEYFTLIVGFFSKLFPIIALPFIILYKSRSTSLKQEIISTLKVIIPAICILVLPLVIINPESIRTYIPARMDIGYFPNTIIWTLYVWIHDILHFSVTMDQVLGFVYVCMGIGLLTLLYAAFKYKKQEPAVLIKFILCAVMIVVLSYKVRSPQYIIWFTPLICILIVDNIYKIGVFYIIQVLAYIEFPLTFGRLWTNIEYTNPIYSTNWYLALMLFTLEFSLLLLLLWLAVEPIKLYKDIFIKSD
jgi:hypothetical protein